MRTRGVRAAAVQAVVFGVLFAVGQAVFGDGADVLLTVVIAVLMFGLLCLLRRVDHRAATPRAGAEAGQPRRDEDAGAG